MQSSNPQAPSGKRPLMRKLLILVFIGLPLGLALGEGSARLLLWSRGQAYDGVEARAGMLELRSRVTDSLPRPGEDLQQKEVKQKALTKIIHPFLGFEELGSLEQVRADKLRCSERDPNFYRIVILGGSVSGLFSLHGAPRLRELIQDAASLKGRRVEFLGYARGGYKQPQQLLRLVHLLVSGVRADAVLNLDGFNEVALGNKNRSQNMDPSYPSFSHWMRFARALGEDPQQHSLFVRADRAKQDLVDVIDAALEADHYWSALWGHLAENRVGRARVGYETARDDYMAELKKGGVAPGVLGPGFEGSAAEAIAECVELWMECSRQIQVLCDLYDMDYLHVLQPTLHDPGAKPMAKRELEKGKISDLWLEAVLLGYPLLREAGAQLAREGVAFFDATMVFADVEQALYYDSCHVNKEGNLLLAEAIAGALLDLLDS